MKRFYFRAAVLTFVAICACFDGNAGFAATLTRGLITLEYTEGREGLALETMSELESGIAVYGRQLPPGEDPIRVRICETLDEFRDLSGGLPARGVVGFARSQEGVIVLKSPRLLGPKTNYASIVRHELLHVLLARNTNPENLPRWLNEGIAMTLSRENRWGSMFAMARMYTGGRIIEFDDLELVFSTPGNETVFGEAYTQSLSMTQFLQKRLDGDRFWPMVRDLQTDEFEQALLARTGFTPRGLYEAWRASLWRTALIASLLTGFSIFQVAAVLLVLAYVRRSLRNRKIVRNWTDEEQEENDLPLG